MRHRKSAVPPYVLAAVRRVIRADIRHMQALAGLARPTGAPPAPRSAQDKVYLTGNLRGIAMKQLEQEIRTRALMVVTAAGGSGSSRL